MTFSQAIEKIMPEIESGSNEPLIFYRDNNKEWQCDFTQNQYGEVYDWVDDVKSQDPFAVTFTGADFARGSFSNTYDRILNERFRAEYESAPFYDAELDELTAIMNMLEENIGNFTARVTDYLTSFDRPLAALYDMTQVCLRSDDPHLDYNFDKVDIFIESVENVVYDRLHNRKKQEIPGELEGLERSVSAYYKSNKRIIAGYDEKFSIPLAGKHVIFAENSTEAAHYLVCLVKSDNILNIEESYNDEIFADYVDAMHGFTDRLDGLIYELETERSAFGLAPNMLTSAYCLPDSKSADFNGKLLIVKADNLAPEYRSAEHQLVLCTGGFGANPLASGKAVYVKELYSEKECRYDRHKIEGIADPDKLPAWAINKLNKLQNIGEQEATASTAMATEKAEKSQVASDTVDIADTSSPMSELKQRLYRLELANIGFENPVYFPDVGKVRIQADNDRLPIIDNIGDIHYGTEHDQLVKTQIRPLVNKINEMTAAWENASPVPFEHLSNYRILVEHNNTALAARDDGEYKRGLHFVVWSYDADRMGFSQGYYTEDYAAAKENFALRAGLVEKEKVVTAKEAADISAAIEDYVLNSADVYFHFEREERLNDFNDGLYSVYPKIFEGRTPARYVDPDEREKLEEQEVNENSANEPTANPQKPSTEKTIEKSTKKQSFQEKLENAKHKAAQADAQKPEHGKKPKNHGERE